MYQVVRALWIFSIFQDSYPNPLANIPLYIIEETKTDDSESRNTGIYQRASKFVYASSIFPNARKIMLYSLQISQKIHSLKRIFLAQDV